MSVPASPRAPRLRATLRESERVTPLELFFDLVFVLAITQCTALMVHDPTWESVAKAMLLLGLLWWAWTGYAWLTSVVAPEDGGVRIAIFAAMAGLLVVALCVPRAFDSEGTLFAAAYGVVRLGHIALFVIASRDEPQLRHSVLGLAGGTFVGVSILVIGSFFEGEARFAIWSLALLLDVAEPYLFGSEGWRLAPSHFAERHGLIMIVALGESIVAIGVASTADIDAGVVAAATFGIVVAAALWWLYFDVVALVAEQRLVAAEPGRAQNEMARDSYSYLHFPMIAGIVLVALGIEQTIAHVHDPLELVPASAALGGVALYLLAHVAFRYRNVHTLNRQRSLCALLLVALIPLAVEVEALYTLAGLAAIMVVLVVYELHVHGEARTRLRRAVAEGTLHG